MFVGRGSERALCVGIVGPPLDCGECGSYGSPVLEATETSFQEIHVDMKLVYQPAPRHRLGDLLREELARDWTDFRAAVAFVKSSGVRHLAEPLANFSRKGRIDLVVGIDHGGTSYEGLRDLMASVGSGGRVSVFHNTLPFTFHPKVYVFKSAKAAEVFIGSGNLTEGGLFTNYEVGTRVRLDLTKADQAAFLRDVDGLLDEWTEPTSGTVLVLNETVLAILRDSGLIPEEATTTHLRTSTSATVGASSAAEELFEARTEHRAPRAPRSRKQGREAGPASGVGTPGRAVDKDSHLRASRFVMTLQRTDVGVGQTSAGTAKRSPEIFVPLSARKANPKFWAWPESFQEDPAKPGKFDRKDVRVRLAGRTERVNMMTWPDRHDFRLRSAALRDAGDVDDILKMEEVPPGLGYDYYVEIIPQGSQEYAKHFLYCAHVVRGRSRKRFGYF